MFLSDLFRCCRPRGRILWVLGPFGISPGGVAKTPHRRRWPLTGDIDMALTMNTIQQCVLTIKPVDAKGHPAPVDGIPVWLSDNTDVLSLTPADDGLTCVAAAVGIPGTAKVQVSCDADLGAGVTLLVGTLDVSVTAAPATTIVIDPGPPTDQP